jgi:hypothetical protein
MLKLIFNTNQSIIVDIYADGRVYFPSQPNQNYFPRLIRLFERMVKEKGLHASKPGRYTFKVTKVKGLEIETELVPLEQ